MPPAASSPPTDAPWLLRAESLRVAFADHPPVLENVEFEIEAGDFVSIVGPSGCGKTTILRLIAGLATPSSGELQVNGRPQIAYVFQESNLLPWRTVVENIRLPLELLGIPRSEQKESIQDSLALIGLRPSDHDKYPRMLSGGMRMRVSLARALATRPEILLLDEPFAALDDMLRQQLNEDLLRIWLEQKWTAMFVTHNVSEAVFLSRRILLMRANPGSIAETIDVPFPLPRSPDLRGRPEFAELTAHVSQRLRTLST